MQLKDVAPIGIVFIIAGIVLGIGSNIVRDVGEQGPTSTVTNETVTIVNGTCSRLANPIASMTYVWNYTGTAAGDDPLVTSGNYTLCDGGDSGILMQVSPCYPGTSYNFTYEARSSLVWRTTANTTQGLGELAGWLPTVGLVIAAALVIGIILSSMMPGKV